MLGTHWMTQKLRLKGNSFCPSKLRIFYTAFNNSVKTGKKRKRVNIKEIEWLTLFKETVAIM